MTKEERETMRAERDALISEYLRASRGRLTLSEARLTSMRERIDKLDQAIENLEAPSTKGN